MGTDEPTGRSAVVGPGRANGLTDVSGIEVGHCTRIEGPFLTGTTVILAPGGAVAAADVRGGAPATRDTDALDPRALVDAVHGIVVSGGSAFGLDAAGGAMRWLEEHCVGRRVGVAPDEVVPVVPAAALFDLGRGGSFRARPDVSFGYEAARAATPGRVAEGNVGAGTGALIGNLWGLRLKGGVGTASAVTSSGETIAALAVVNAFGQAVDPSSGLPYAAALGLPGEFPVMQPASSADLERHLGVAAPIASQPSHTTSPSSNTVVVVVATDAMLSKPEVADVARTAQSGLPRAVRPAHTRFDGDIVFALSTGARPLLGRPAAGTVPAPGQPVPDRLPDVPSVASSAGSRDLALALLGQVAADCLSRAVVHALLAAASVRDFIAYRDAFPSVFRARPAFGARGAEGA